MYFGSFLVVLLTGGVVKPAVMLLSAWLLWSVYRGRSGRPTATLRALAGRDHAVTGRFLFWGLLAFVVSELVCGIEVYVLLRPSVPLGLVHSYSSAVGAALILYGTVTAFDRRALHYFDESRPCLLVGICKGCPRREGQSCRFHPAFFWGVCLLILTAMPLLAVPVRDLLADPAEVALPFPSLNAFFDNQVVPGIRRYLPQWDPRTLRYAIPSQTFLAEFRHLPVVTIVLGLAGLGMSFVRRRQKLAFLLVCLAAGPLMYAYLEAAVYVLIPQAHLGSLGHETAEVLGLLLLRSVLRQVLGAGS